MVSSEVLGHMPTGEQVHLFTISTPRARLRLMEFGAALLSLEVPDASGTAGDVLLGMASLEDYFDNPACHGSTVGPIANRTDGAEMIIGSSACHLAKNDGPGQRNNLHTSLVSGLHKRVWRAVADEKRNAVRLTCRLGEGELGLPGNRTFTCHVSLVDLPNDTTQVTITYTCTTDALTFVNMTNHSYFNLAGHDAGTAMGTIVRLEADEFLPIREDSVSTGEIRSVNGTPFDFREPKTLGRDIDGNDEQLRRARGYDHCFCIRGWKPGAPPRRALVAHDPKSGRTLEIRVTTPGAHLYTGNWLDDAHAKGGGSYGVRAGFAFEPEFYPDCTHHLSWPQPVCTPYQPYAQTIVYQLGTIAR